MKNKILERLREEFLFIGSEQISGNTALKLIESVVEELTIPREVEQAQKYVADCHADIGFMGSTEYDRQKKIIADYFEPIEKREKEEAERKEYLRLQARYGQ